MNERPDRTRVIVGGGAAIVAPDGRLLLVHQEHPRGRDWGYVGGGLEAGESIEECVIREAFEESGLRIRLRRLLCVDQFWKDGGMYGIGFIFLAEPDGWPQDVVLPAEDDGTRFLGFRWIDRAEFGALQADPEYDFARLPWPEDIPEQIFRRTDA
jgi:ADP-ribose pyrophosphatase YjhB (NUDIX family)